MSVVSEEVQTRVHALTLHEQLNALNSIHKAFERVKEECLEMTGESIEGMAVAIFQNEDILMLTNFGSLDPAGIESSIENPIEGRKVKIDISVYPSSDVASEAASLLTLIGMDEITREEAFEMAHRSGNNFFPRCMQEKSNKW